MSTLCEIGLEYEKSAKLLSVRLSELRAQLKTTTDPEDIWKLKRRIYELTPMLTQCNKLAKRCKKYYDIRTVGSGRSGSVSPSNKSQKVGAIDFNNTKRTHSAASASSKNGSSGGQNNDRSCRRIKRLQEYNIADLSSGNA